jgi:maltose alpha-D-glucosyltransferase / alpha-amylase
MSDPHWYKDAIIYEAHVRSFFDSNNDGIGDFPGLTSKLPYLHDLGINCLWVLPFYPSPLRDDGYDIADYRSVNPMYGTIDDFRRFVDEAHRLSIRVITELVVNHTSDQHPWFQRARHAPKGSPEREFYVWSDADTKYADTRIIFIDTEKSNWTYDPVAGQYYWHRFFSHQPDLNWDNLDVFREVVDVMRYWLDMGVDGLRLDAIPYLIEREGTINENLSETHDVLKRIRRELDAQHPGRVLLAEANQWPADVRPYFGDGDECHMAFHFPLMPRMFMGIRQEERHPIVEIMNQTPEIPDNCQWAIFLRNHDELTLEMVTDEERDYMYQAYATDPQMRINVGIRRRLAPLMENNRQRIELMNGLIFSLPGTPVIYYGDEIGMGDNIYLGDRNGVRTPMQWTSDRNGGFSRADPARLFAPPVMDPIWGYQALNVEAQERSPSSLLNWMKRIIALRARHRTFGRGGIRFISPPNRKILAYVREHEGETILCVANLARSAQPAELDLREWNGRVPVEMVGSTEFPRIGELPYFLTLAPYGFYWFLLAEAPAPPVVERPAPRSAPKPPSALDLPPLLLGVVWDTAFTTATHEILERDSLPVHLATRRWFAAKARPLRQVLIRDHALVRGGPEPVFLTLLEVQYEDGGSEVYVLPMAFLGGKPAEDLLRESPELVIARVSGARKGVLHERLDWGVASLLLDAIAGGLSFSGREGLFVASRTNAFDELRGPVDPASPLPVHRSSSEQSNTSFIFGEQLIMKLIRRVEPGPNPELEISYHLTERVQFPRAPRLAGAIEYEEQGGTRSTLAVLHGLVHYQATGWEQALNEAGRYLEDAASEAGPPSDAGDVAAELGVLLPGNVRVPQGVADRLGWYVDAALRLGRRTADLHLALASAQNVSDFEPQPLTADDLSATITGIRTLATQTGQLLDAQMPTLPPNVQELASAALSLLPDIVGDLEHSVRAVTTGLLKTRIHGDYHLGQVLWDSGDFYIIDFE